MNLKTYVSKVKKTDMTHFRNLSPKVQKEWRKEQALMNTAEQMYKTSQEKLAKQQSK